MTLPQLLSGLSLPAIAAPMFLASAPEMVVAACRSGIVGAFPALNQRTTEGYAAWLDTIAAGVAAGPLPGAGACAPHAVNLIVHRTNRRLEADLAVTCEKKVPLVITSLGAATHVVDAIHGYGGCVVHDVITLNQARRALDAGVDGIIAVAAGAGGHGGTLNPFPFLDELRLLTDKPLILAGTLSHGRQIAAARLAGADAVSIGTRFLATRECVISDDYKQMVVDARAGDIVYTDRVSGVYANFLGASLIKAGVRLDAPRHEGPLDLGKELQSDSKAWKDIWSAGQGVGGIQDLPGVAELVTRLRDEYRAALTGAPGLIGNPSP